MGDGFFIDINKIEYETKFLAEAAGSLTAANDVIQQATMEQGALTLLGQLPEMKGAESLPTSYNQAITTISGTLTQAIGSIMDSINVIEKRILAQYQGTDAGNMKSVIFAGSGLTPDGTEVKDTTKGALTKTQPGTESFQPFQKN